MSVVAVLIASRYGEMSLAYRFVTDKRCGAYTQR